MEHELDQMSLGGGRKAWLDLVRRRQDERIWLPRGTILHLLGNHKWFLGPKETGILYMCKDKVKNFMPSIFAYDEAISVPDPWYDDLPDTAQLFAMLGQRDDVNIINLTWMQVFWLLLARRKPYDRVAYLAQSLKKKLENDSWELVTPVDEERSSGVVRINAPRGQRPMNLYNWLYVSKNGYQIAGSAGDSDFRWRDLE